MNLPFKSYCNVNSFAIICACVILSSVTSIKDVSDICIVLQVLSAQDVVRTIPDVTSLEGFGFSLSSGVDVDGNEFNG